MSYAKAMMRVIMKFSRHYEFNVEQGKQALTDVSFICDLFMDSIDKEEESIILGFYHGIVQGIRENCEGDCRVKTDKLTASCIKKRNGAIKFVN